MGGRSMIEYLFLIIGLIVLFRMFCDLTIVNIAGTNVTYFTIIVEIFIAILFIAIFLYLKKKKE